MFLRATTRNKDGKEHRYWSVVENRRGAGGRVGQRHVLYLGEINSSKELAWRRSIEEFAAVQMVDVHIPTTDGRELALLLERLHLELPAQPPPKISTAQAATATPCSADLRARPHGKSIT